MTICKVKMSPEGKEVLVRVGYRFAVAYWLRVEGKPCWFPGAVIEGDFGNCGELSGEPIEWSYLPSGISQAAPSYASQ